MSMRGDPSPPVPPPLPAHHPVQKQRFLASLRIPLLFYVDLVFGGLLLLTAAWLLSQVVSLPLPLLWLGEAAVFLACVKRLVARVRAEHAKGAPRIEHVVLFWAVKLLVPAALITWGSWKFEERRREARESEPRALLGSALAAERAFFREYRRYSLSFPELSYGAPPHRSYQLGFPTACAVKAGVDARKAQPEMEGPRDPPVPVREFFLKIRNPEDCKDPKEGFEAFAVGILAGGKLDVWRVDETGAVAQVPFGN